MPNYKMHLISHTHWDREFYLPFQEFRIKLVDLMDRLLDLLDRDPEFRFFHLDGQTIMIKDYLEIKPENEELIRKYAQNGRLLVGPKFQLNDHFLVSPEAHVRNFIIGLRQSKEYTDNPMMVGYCADEFGLISQYPQILRGFGIDTAMYGRGIFSGADRKMEHIWESPDGSQVLGIIMFMWFNNAQDIPVDRAKSQELIDRLRGFYENLVATPHLYLGNGVDHLEAQQDLTEGMRVFRELAGDDELIHSTMPAYLEAVREYVEDNDIQLKVYRGELREDTMGHILAGTLSTRIYLKQNNEKCQTGIEKYAEPASAFAWMLGEKYPFGMLDYTWRLLMQNHPHDSICGCSCDPVHREMQMRFQQVQQVTDELATRGFTSVAEQVKTDSETLVVFNPLGWSRTDKVTANVDFPISEEFRGPGDIDWSMDVAGIELYDASGEAVPFAVRESLTAPRQIMRPNMLAHGQWVRRFVIEFIAKDVPAGGYKSYRITPLSSPLKEGDGELLIRDNVMDNGLVNAWFDGGVFSLRKTGSADVFSGLNAFEDVGEVGDEYRYLPPQKDVIVRSDKSAAKVSVVYNGSISATCKIEQTMMLPASATDDNTGRTPEMLPCPITSYVTISRDIPRIDVRTEIENNSKDHRLRVLFPTEIQTKVSYAEAHYDVTEHPVGIPEHWDPSLASTFHPQLSWVDVNDGKTGLCLINRGLPEYELYGDDNSTLALTLLRCVGNLAGRDIMHVNRVTPDAQCLGKHVFEYSLYPHDGNWLEAQTWVQASHHTTPLYVKQTGAHDGNLPAEASFVHVEPAELIITAIKKAEREDKLIVRFYNTTDDAVEGKVTVRGAKSAENMNLNEEPEQKLEVAADGSVMLKVGAKKIVTLGFGF